MVIFLPTVHYSIGIGAFALITGDEFKINASDLNYDDEGLVIGFGLAMQEERGLGVGAGVFYVNRYGHVLKLIQVGNDMSGLRAILEKTKHGLM
jgi:hypothetical protein